MGRGCGNTKIEKEKIGFRYANYPRKYLTIELLLPEVDLARLNLLSNSIKPLIHRDMARPNIFCINANVVLGADRMAEGDGGGPVMVSEKVGGYALIGIASGEIATPSDRVFASFAIHSACNWLRTYNPKKADWRSASRSTCHPFPFLVAFAFAFVYIVLA